MKPLHGTRIAIIGAGLAGIAAAREFDKSGASVTIFEKSRGLGGRCASKRWEGHIVDHGAQYFTIRDESFRSAVESACGERLRRIAAPVFTEVGETLPDDGRWFHDEGNSRLVRDLAGGLEVRLETTVADASSLLRRNGGDFDQVVSTAPWPQTARLFGLEPSDDYLPCLTVLFAYRGEWSGRTREAYAHSDTSSPLAWTACENHKPGRVTGGFTVVVAHGSETFSREYLERPLDEYPDLIRARVEERWELSPGDLVASLGHRWRYARVANPFPAPDLPDGLHFVGDALRSSRVEDAWLAGHEFARRAFL